MLRRCARLLLMALVVVSFVVSALLFIALIHAEDLERAPCLSDLADGERESDGRRRSAGLGDVHGQSGLRQLNLALAPTFNDQLPVLRVCFR